MADALSKLKQKQNVKILHRKKIGCLHYFNNDSTNSFANELNLTIAEKEPNSFGKL